MWENFDKTGIWIDSNLWLGFIRIIPGYHQEHGGHACDGGHVQGPRPEDCHHEADRPQQQGVDEAERLEAKVRKLQPPGV